MCLFILLFFRKFEKGVVNMKNVQCRKNESEILSENKKHTNNNYFTKIRGRFQCRWVHDIFYIKWKEKAAKTQHKNTTHNANIRQNINWKNNHA